MAREERDREDLLREATRLTDRVELRFDWHDDSVVCGFRCQDALSLFVGQDEVYHFDTRQALRRGYWRGQLLKAEKGRLVALTRQRTDTETRLLRRELSESEQSEHLRRLSTRVRQLLGALTQNQYESIGEVSGSGRPVVARVVAWLEQFPASIEIAQTPRVDSTSGDV